MLVLEVRSPLHVEEEQLRKEKEAGATVFVDVIVLARC